MKKILFNLLLPLCCAGPALALQAEDATTAETTNPEATTSEQGVPAAESVAMLQLRDGSICWGSIEEHSPDGLDFRRLDTGGLVRLPWGLLDPNQERDFRQQFVAYILRQGGIVIGNHNHT